MVEKHYVHFCPSAKANLIRNLAPILGFVGDLVVQLLEIKVCFRYGCLI